MLRRTIATTINDGMETTRLTKFLSHSAGRHHPARRYRQQVSPVRPRHSRRHRALPVQDHPPHVQDEAGEAQQGQALHQGRQLQPLDAHPLHPRARGPQGCHLSRHLQVSQPLMDCGNSCLRGLGRAGVRGIGILQIHETHPAWTSGEGDSWDSR